MILKYFLGVLLVNVENLIIKDCSKSEVVSGQHNIEYDLLLPDYYDNIGKILKCSVNPFVESVTASGDRLSIAGNLHLSLFYLGEDSQLYCYENDIKYTKIINSNGSDVTDNCSINQDITSFNYRAIGPKRIDIKGILQLTVRKFNNEDIVIVDSINKDGIYLKKEDTNGIIRKGMINRVFSVSDNLIFESVRIKSIIRKNCKVDILEKKAVANKVFIKGICLLTMVYIEEETAIIKSLTKEISFSEVLDAYSVEENDIIIISNITNKISNNINNETSDNSQISVNIDISLNLNLYTALELSYIKDVYSNIGDIAVGFADLCIYDNFAIKNVNTNVEFEADVFSESSFVVCDSNIDDIKLSIEYEEENIKAIINANYCALIKLDDGSYNYVFRNFTKECALCLNGNQREVRLIEIKLLSNSALQIGSGKIKFSADYYVEYIVADACKVKVLSKIDCDNVIETSEEKGYMVYYAQKGEEIWDIAKENRSDIQSIISINELSDTVLSEEKMLVFPIF